VKHISKTPKLKRDGRLLFRPNDEEKIRYKTINREIVKKYHIQVESRNYIIRQIIDIFTQNSENNQVPIMNFTIIRTDINNFFPSINKHKLYQKINRSSILSNDVLNILKQLFFSKSIKGIPLGFPFSNSLAEIYLENFDQDIFYEFQTKFYYRYVDDIFIILYGQSEEDTELLTNKLKNIFLKYNLNINTEKTKILYFDPKNNPGANFSVDYLGYKLFVSPISNKKYKLTISIADKKFDKIKNQISSVFIEFRNSSHKDEFNIAFWKLYYKLRNILYGITSYDKNNKKIQFGLGFTYRYIDDDSLLNEIVKFILNYCYTVGLYKPEINKIRDLIRFKETSLEIIHKRYDYTRLTKRQLSEIARNLKIVKEPITVSNIFNILYKK